MLHLLVVAAVAGQGSLFQQIVTAHDPRNGYEDYVRAADIAAPEDFRRYLNFLPQPVTGPDDDQRLYPVGVTVADDNLSIRRKWQARYAQALAMVRTGNSKDVYDPRQGYSMQTLFPEYAYFKSLVRLESNAAYLSFADGNPEAGTSAFIEGFTFSDKLAAGPLISRLIGIACWSILMRDLDRQLPALDLASAERIEHLADEELAKNNASYGLEQELSHVPKTLDEMFDDPKGAFGPDDTPKDGTAQEKEDARKTREAVAAIQQLSPADKLQVKQQVLALIHRQADLAVSTLRGSDSGWLQLTTNQTTTPTSSLAGLLFDLAWGDGFSNQMVNVEARQRIKVRLLKLSALAIEYRWHNGKLPEGLADFTAEDERTDPVTGQQFTYQKDGPWFKLEGAGFGSFKSFSLSASPPLPEFNRHINP